MNEQPAKEALSEDKPENGFKPTEPQLKMSRDVVQHLHIIGLTQVNIAIGDRDSVRMDINVPKKKTIVSLFIYPEGNLEYDKYSTRHLKQGDKLEKERDFIESKCTDFKSFCSDINDLSDIRKRL